MFDRQTWSLWSNLGGEPVVGKMAAGGLKLQILPMTLTTWEEWKNSHPDTKVLYLDDTFGMQWNYRYVPGLADRSRQGVSFPVWNKNKILKDKEEVYGIRIGDQAKAYVIETLRKERVVNDQVGNVPIVLIIDPSVEAVRAYKRGSTRLSFSGDQLLDAQGRALEITEEALISGNTRLERMPGHVSWWFAWFGFFPHTEIYR